MSGFRVDDLKGWTQIATSSSCWTDWPLVASQTHPIGCLCFSFKSLYQNWRFAAGLSGQLPQLGFIRTVLMTLLIILCQTRLDVVIGEREKKVFLLDKRDTGVCLRWEGYFWGVFYTRGGLGIHWMVILCLSCWMLILKVYGVEIIWKRMFSKWLIPCLIILDEENVGHSCHWYPATSLHIMEASKHIRSQCT